ncbi:hypothetical protein D9M72_189330 [compost metagenome]
MLPAQAFGGGDKDFQRGVAGAGAHAGQAGVDAVAALFHRDDGIGHTQAQVVMGVHARLGFRLEHVLERAEALAHVLHAQRAAGIDHIDALGAVAFHQLRLLRQRRGRGHVAHHQEADGVHAEFARVFDVLARDIGFGAVRGHAHHARAGVIGGAQVVHGAHARQKQRGHAGTAHGLGHGGDPFQVGMGTKAVVEAGARQPVAMRDLDRIHARGVERGRDAAHVVQAVLVADGVAAVAQRHVGDVELLGKLYGHVCLPAAHADSRVSARRSAQASAALVMMSRLPA